MMYRELYCPAHFGNSYEVMWSNEMRDLLAEAKHWGFTHYGDWFDNQDLRSPASLGLHDDYSTGPELRRRKISHYRSAAAVGLGLDLVLTPNHVYVDQVRDNLAAERAESHVFGQLICPSISEARDIIIGNHRDLFRELYEAGVALSSISACPYDFGGCTCEKCKPWIVTFGKLVVDIYEAAREFFPDIVPRLIGWWWRPEDHVQFNAWANRDYPGLFQSLASYIKYGEYVLDATNAFPNDCESHAFIHIGYADRHEPHDLYGGWGPTIAPNRIERTVRDLSAKGYTGYMAYSEGQFDDINKALLAGLSSGAFNSAHDVLRAYAERYFGATGADIASWMEWIESWGAPFERDVVHARRDFDRLAKSARRSWRLDQLEAKLRLFEAHADVMRRAEWDAERISAAERWYAERERLQRRVWGLGLTRHIFSRSWGANRPSWENEYLEHASKSAYSGSKIADA